MKVQKLWSCQIEEYGWSYIDYTIPEPVLDPAFIIQIPDISCHDTGLQLLGNIIQVFAEESRSHNKAECGSAIVLPEIMAILYQNIPYGAIRIVTDSNAIIRFLEDTYSTSKTLGCLWRR